MKNTNIKNCASKVELSNWLTSPLAIRESCLLIYQAGLNRELAHFEIDLDKLEEVVGYVKTTIFENYPTLNIVISGLSSVHKRAEITYVVGDTEYWGKGVASYAISEIVKKSKTDYKLNRLYAGLAEGNTGSARVLEKNGFKLEGKRLNHLFYGGEFHNQLDYGLLL